MVYNMQHSAKRNIIYNRPDFHKNARDRRIWYYFAVWSMAKYPDHFCNAESVEPDIQQRHGQI